MPSVADFERLTRATGSGLVNLLLERGGTSCYVALAVEPAR